MTSVHFSILDLLLVSPALILFLTSLVSLSLKTFGGGKEPRTALSVFIGILGITIAGVLAISNYGVNQTAFEKALVFDGLAGWGTVLILLAAAVSLVFARENLSTSSRQFSEFIFLILNAAVGMMLVTWANDLMILFIGIEVMSLCLYLAIALSYEEVLSKEAAFKYFVLGSFASAIFLYGVAFLYGTTGGTYLLDIAEVASDLISTNRLFLFGVVMILVGLGFKIAVVPFHSWLPDVYQGAPTPITSFMATGVKVAVFLSLLRLVATQVLSGERTADLIIVLQWLAVMTMLVGNLVAIRQNNLKRMLAYSSIAHSGYIFVGLLAAGVGENAILGASGVLFYIFAYTIMTLGSFGVVSLLEKNESSMVEIEDLKGMAHRSPLLSACLALFLLSLAGIPPTIGFFGKFYIFAAAIKQGFFWVSFWGILSSAIGVYYYLRPIVYMYMTEGGKVSLISSRVFSQALVIVCALLVLIVGIFSHPFYDSIRKSFTGLF